MYIRIWQFRINPIRKSEFIHACGPTGDWAQLFKKAQGYISTELIQSTLDTALFITIDRWESEESWKTFSREFAREYAELDQRFEPLTAEEKEIGVFQEID